jgi:hypothetical protein
LAVETYDKALRAAKRKYWRTFYGEVHGYQMGALRLPSGDFTISDREAAKHLLMTHFPGFQPIEEHHSSGRVLQEPA